MKLPNTSDVVVSAAKIADYLLSLSHPIGRSKARFFLGFGFRLDRGEVLIQALKEHAARHEVSRDRVFSLRDALYYRWCLECTGWSKPAGADRLVHRKWGRHGLFRNRLSFAGLKQVIHELEPVALTVDLPEHGLKKDDVGAVVAIHKNAAGYEVEFVTLAGETVGVVSLKPTQIRSIGQRELPHVRAMG